MKEINPFDVIEEFLEGCVGRTPKDHFHNILTGRAANALELVRYLEKLQEMEDEE